MLDAVDFSWTHDGVRVSVEAFASHQEALKDVADQTAVTHYFGNPEDRVVRFSVYRDASPPGLFGKYRKSEPLAQIAVSASALLRLEKPVRQKLLTHVRQASAEYPLRERLLSHGRKCLDYVQEGLRWGV